MRMSDARTILGRTTGTKADAIRLGVDRIPYLWATPYEDEFLALTHYTEDDPDCVPLYDDETYEDAENGTLKGESVVYELIRFDHEGRTLGLLADGCFRYRDGMTLADWLDINGIEADSPVDLTGPEGEAVEQWLYTYEYGRIFPDRVAP